MPQFVIDALAVVGVVLVLGGIVLPWALWTERRAQLKKERERSRRQREEDRQEINRQANDLKHIERIRGEMIKRKNDLTNRKPDDLMIQIRLVDYVVICNASGKALKGKKHEGIQAKAFEFRDKNGNITNDELDAFIKILEDARDDIPPR